MTCVRACGRIHELALPWATPPLTLNSRMHWTARARVVAEVRQTVGWVARAHRIGRHETVRVGLIYTPATRRRRDSDNLAATYKPCVDGLVDAGVVVDDDDLHVVRCWPEIRPPDPSRAGLVLTVAPGRGASPPWHLPSEPERPRS